MASPLMKLVHLAASSDGTRVEVGYDVTRKPANPRKAKQKAQRKARKITRQA